MSKNSTTFALLTPGSPSPRGNAVVALTMQHLMTLTLMTCTRLLGPQLPSGLVEEARLALQLHSQVVQSAQSPSQLDRQLERPQQVVKYAILVSVRLIRESLSYSMPPIARLILH